MFAKAHPTTANGPREEANSKAELINTEENSAAMDVSSGFAFMSTLASLTEF